MTLSIAVMIIAYFAIHWVQFCVFAYVRASAHSDTHTYIREQGHVHTYLRTHMFVRTLARGQTQCCTCRRVRSCSCRRARAAHVMHVQEECVRHFLVWVTWKEPSTSKSCACQSACVRAWMSEWVSEWAGGSQTGENCDHGTHSTTWKWLCGRSAFRRSDCGMVAVLASLPASVEPKGHLELRHSYSAS